MERYAVFRIGHPFYRLHATYDDDRRAAEAYNAIVARREAVLARVRDTGAVTVLAAGGLSAEGVANDPVFHDAVRGAVGGGSRPLPGVE